MAILTKGGATKAVLQRASDVIKEALDNILRDRANAEAEVLARDLAGDEAEVDGQSGSTPDPRAGTGGESDKEAARSSTRPGCRRWRNSLRLWR